MNAILERVDDMLLDATQKVSDVVHRTTGIGNWSIALGLLRAGLFLIMLSQALMLPGSGILGFVIVGLLSLLWFHSYNTCRILLGMQRSSRDAGRAVRVSERKRRTIGLVVNILASMLIMTSPTLSSWLVIAAMVVFHLHYYFKAAEMPPPSTSGKTAKA